MAEDAPALSGADALNEAERERLRTLGRVLRVRIDGEWDEQMIEAAFARLERLLSRAEAGELEAAPAEAGAKTVRRSGSAPRRRSRRT